MLAKRRRIYRTQPTPNLVHAKDIASLKLKTTSYLLPLKTTRLFTQGSDLDTQILLKYENNKPVYSNPGGRIRIPNNSSQGSLLRLSPHSNQICSNILRA
ncbi:hypothetical protein F511_17465 [Dorcoceras hygrometricum]|uniref:Uncharacterized protein n=1 Tax=Dorcoceras hygrometricum TaxID=472368 RepID=A0A2Z7CA35_9LAMI|nr:hypothetical protein F511_17465 [Dorcoceras hygrometricum]